MVRLAAHVSGGMFDLEIVIPSAVHVFRSSTVVGYRLSNTHLIMDFTIRFVSVENTCYNERSEKYRMCMYGDCIMNITRRFHLKRKYYLLVCAVLAALSLTACKSAGETKEVQNDKASDTETVNIESDEAMGSDASTQNGILTEDVAGEQEEEPQVEPVVLARQALLACSGTDEVFGYQIDDIFCDWFTDNFGEQTLLLWYEQNLPDDSANETVSEQETETAEPKRTTDWHLLTGNTFHALYTLYLQDTNPAAEGLDNVYFKDCASAEEIVMDFTGDINFSEGWDTTLHMDAQENGLYDCFSYELRQEMSKADILVVNNEFVYSTRGEAIEGKAYCYRADPSRVRNLTTLGVDLAGLANNHACDFGPDALLDTFDTLREEGIPYVGAGANLDEAMKPVYFVANGRKIAVVAASQIERSYNYTKQATETTPGVLKTLDSTLFVQVIEHAKANSDHVIVFVHWGTEKQAYYQYDQTDLADAFIGAGADVIVGGHTHCLQGIEYRSGVPVYFSLGNFWQSKKSLDTGIAQIIIDNEGQIACRFLPCIQANLETELITEQDEKNRIWEYMESISTKIAIDDDGYIINRKEE